MVVKMPKFPSPTQNPEIPNPTGRTGLEAEEDPCLTRQHPASFLKGERDAFVGLTIAFYEGSSGLSQVLPKFFPVFSGFVLGL